MGVARCSVGSGGLAAAGCPGWAPTALTFGEGGIARPSLGVRAPPRAPGMAGRRRGTGDAIWGAGLGVDKEGVLEEDGCKTNISTGLPLRLEEPRKTKLTT